MSTKSKEREKNASAATRPTPPDRLFADETVIMTATPSRFASLPKYMLTLGLYEFWRKRNVAIVTDQRILFGEGIFRRTEQSIPLKRVLDVGFTRKGLNSYAEVAVSKRGFSTVTLVGPMSSSEARRFVTEILRRT